MHGSEPCSDGAAYALRWSVIPAAAKRTGGYCGIAMKQPLRRHQAPDRDKAWEGQWLRERHERLSGYPLHCRMAEGRSPRETEEDKVLEIKEACVHQEARAPKERNR